MDNPLSEMIDCMTLTPEELAKIAETEWIVRDMIVRGMLHVFPAKYGTGKTTLCTYLLAPQAIADGYEVVYINADLAPTQAKTYVEFADKIGMNLLLPGIVPGTNAMDVSRYLNKMAESKSDYSNQVLFVDTLKKFCDVNKKSSIKQAMDLFRRLTHRGMTVILVAHTTKHPNDNGDPIYEGTNEVGTEPDNVIMLSGDKDDNKTIISTTIEKSRAFFNERSYELVWEDNTPQFHEIDYVDLETKQAALNQFEEDTKRIEFISKAMSAGKHSCRGIIEHCRDEVSSRQVKRVLHTYKKNNGVPGVKELWSVKRIPEQNNSDYYELIRLGGNTGHTARTA